MGIASFLQTQQYHKKREIATAFRIYFSIFQFGASACSPGRENPSGLLCISPDSLLLFQAVSSCLKRRLAVPLHGNFTPPRFSPSCPHCLSLWLGRSIIVPRWNLRKTICRRPLSGPMESLMPVCFYRRLPSRIVRCRLPPGREPHPGMYFSN